MRKVALVLWFVDASRRHDTFLNFAVLSWTSSCVFPFVKDNTAVEEGHVMLLV